MKQRRTRIDYVTKALCVFVFLIPLDGFYYFSFKVGYSVPTIVGYATFILCLPRVFSIFKIQPASFWICVSIYALGTFLSIVSAILKSERPTMELVSIWQMIALAAIVAYASVSEDGGRALLRSLTLGMAFTMIAYVTLYRMGFEVVDLVQEDRILAVAGYQANQIGYVAVLAVLFTLATYKDWERHTKAFLLYLGLPASAIVMWLSNSRAAILTLGFVLLLYLVLKKIGSRKQVWLLLIPLLVFAYAIRPEVGQNLLSPNEISHQTARWAGSQQKGVDIDYLTLYRSEIIGQSVQLSLENPLGYGIGNGQYLLGPRMSFASLRVIDTHNDYLRVLLDCGVIGLALYVIMLFMFLGVAIRVYRRDGLLWPLLALVGMSAFSFMHNCSYFKITWIPVGLIFGLTIRESRKMIKTANEQHMRMALYTLLINYSRTSLERSKLRRTDSS